MATVSIKSGMPEDLDWQRFFEAGDVSAFTAQESQYFIYRVNVGGTDYEVTVQSNPAVAANNFTYDDDPGADDNPYYGNPVPTGGTIYAISVMRDPDGSPEQALFIFGLNVSAVDFLRSAFDFDDPYTGNHRNGDGWRTVSLLLSGNDTISVASDVTWNVRTTIGENVGNDTFNGGSVDDYFEASKGNDYYDGKAGVGDTLSYSWPTYEGRNGAFKGIVLDAIGKKVKALGTVKDSWGNVDTFRNIENFEGSKFADTMLGANQPQQNDEWFFGLGGNDTIDGRGSWDWVSYEKDIEFGGMKGIVANLFVVDKKGFSTIKDGFGNLDKVKNVEAVMGTNFKDTLIGNNKDNAFQGLLGNDIIDGKGGKDLITFWKNERYAGLATGDGKVVVDLSGPTDGAGYISINDGLGGTDKIKNIEGAWGANFDDTFTGNEFANEFHGHTGSDILDGKAGHDWLEGGGDGDEFHFSAPVIEANSDEINDFNSLGEGDRIVLHASAFTALNAYIGDNDIGSAFAANAGGVVSAGVYITYDTNNGNLYYDADSDGVGAKVLIAHLAGTPGVAFDDFDVVA